MQIGTQHTNATGGTVTIPALEYEDLVSLLIIKIHNSFQSLTIPFRFGPTENMQLSEALFFLAVSMLTPSTY